LTEGAAFLVTVIVQLSEVLHSRAKPPTSTVAVIVCPPVPVVSTLIVEVPCPEEIVPAETVQLKVGVTPESPPDTSAVYVGSAPSSASAGQETRTTGQCEGVGVGCGRVCCADDGGA
jgi:hypothetical protein